MHYLDTTRAHVNRLSHLSKSTQENRTKYGNYMRVLKTGSVLNRVHSTKYVKDRERDRDRWIDSWLDG